MNLFNYNSKLLQFSSNKKISKTNNIFKYMIYISHMMMIMIFRVLDSIIYILL